LKVDLKVDDTRLLRKMRNGHKRLAYAVVNAINKTAKRIQAAERRRAGKVFTVRKTEFIRRQVAVIKPFASVPQGRPFAEIRVGDKPRLLLSAFERGAERKPVTAGASRVAEPVVGGPARPSFGKPVDPQFYMKKLKFDRTKSGKLPISARRTKTYLVPDTGIFQRTEAGVRAVYLFTVGKRLRPILRFVETARQVANKWFAQEMKKEVQKTIEFQRRR
jgi:hypothetical protein